MENVCVDVTDDESVRAGLARVRHGYGADIASVVHLAAYYDFSGEPSDLYDEVTVQGTARLLAALREFRVEQLLFSSTMLVHAPTQPGEPLDEDSPLEGKWDYPASKIRTERVIADEGGDIPAVILRIAGAYTDRCDSIPLSRQIQRIAERRLTAHVYPGDTSHGQAFVHLDDVVLAIVTAVDKRRELSDHEVFLVGEPETCSYEAIQQRLGWLLHGEDDWQTRSIPKSVAEAGAWLQNNVPGVEEPFIKAWMIDMADDHYELDISRAKTRLGWQPQHRLLESLPHMTERLRADAQAWYEAHDLEAPQDLEVAPGAQSRD